MKNTKEKSVPYIFHLGNVEVKGNINELREYVEEIQEKIGAGEEYCKYISDFCFDVEAAYQRHHNLGADDWSMVHGEHANKN